MCCLSAMFVFFLSWPLCHWVCVFLCSEAAAKVMVELLGSYTEDNASQARVDAHRYTHTHLYPPVIVILPS